MNASYFSITRAVRNAYIFVGLEWRYLARIAVLPMGLNLLTELAILILIQQPSNFEEPSLLSAALLNIPAIAFSAWFMFAEARLILLGERTDNLPADPAYREERQRDLSISVLIFILFYLGLMAFLNYWFLIHDLDPLGQNLTYTTIGLLLFCAGVWAVRFGVAHILSAVGYPVRRYIYRVNGLGISFRLLGMALLCMLPILLAMMFVMMIVMPDMKSLQPSVTTVILDAPMSFAIWSVMTAAACFALKEILGRAPEKTP